MAPDTEQEVTKLKATSWATVASLAVTLVTVAVTGIAWSIRLEAKVETASTKSAQNEARLEDVQKDSNNASSRLTKLEVQMTTILEGIQDIKTTLKDRRP